MFADKNTPCCSQFTPACTEGAVCEPNERLIRRVVAGDHTIPLRPDEREWMIAEADACGEGAYPQEETQHLSDVELAKTTLNAWSDYVQSNCL